MKLGKIVAGEIKHRRLNFTLGALAVLVAGGVLSGTGAMLRGHDTRTEEIITLKEEETRAEMARLEDDYRIAMRRLGHNVLIVHRDQDMSEMRARGYPTAYMPEDYALRLGKGDITTLNHLLPVLQAGFHWPEKDREIILVGMHAQVPVYAKSQFLTEEGVYRNPIQQPIPDGKAALGAEIASSIDVSRGDTISIRGEEFEVLDIYPPRGNQDDITVWAPLDRVQSWLGRKGLITGIFALECICDPDDLGRITREVTRILPDTQVFEFSSLIRARAEVRNRAEELHREAVAAEIRNRLALRRERERLAGILVPTVIITAIVWVMVLAFNNVRERRPEIGILRAVGFRSGQVLSAFLARAALTGLVGILPGYFAGLAAGYLVTGAAAPLGELFNARLLLLFLISAPLMSCLAAFFPALSAAAQDPALILRED